MHSHKLIVLDNICISVSSTNGHTDKKATEKRRKETEFPSPDPPRFQNGAVFGTRSGLDIIIGYYRKRRAGSGLNQAGSKLSPEVECFG